MKKFVSMALALLMLTGLFGCGAKQEGGSNKISKLYDDGYECVMSSSEENTWKGIFKKGDNYEELYLATAGMTDEEYEKFTAAFDAEDSEEATKKVLSTLSDVDVQDITDKLPTQEELDGYIGKTLGDLEKEGFENTGNTESDGICQFFYDGPLYSCTVTLEDGVKIEDMDNYSKNDLRAMKISGMEFTGVSYYIMDNLDAE